MAFGYNRTSGSAAQVVGDLIAGIDTQRNTKIDFENDQINFVVGGNTVVSLTPTQISASLYSGIATLNIGCLSLYKGKGSNLYSVVIPVPVSIVKISLI